MTDLKKVAIFNTPAGGLKEKGKYSEKTSSDSKRSFESVSQSSSQASARDVLIQKRAKVAMKAAANDKSPKPKKRCKGCGWELRRDAMGDLKCTRSTNGCRDDPRRNPSNDEWEESPVGKKWISLGYRNGLPKDVTITTKNAIERKHDFMGKMNVMLQNCSTIALTAELIPFSVNDCSQPKRRQMEGRTRSGHPPSRKVRTGRRTTKDSAPTALSGNALLDTGAIGRCVVSSSFYDKIVSHVHNYAVSSVDHELSSALSIDNNNTAITKEISFVISLLSEGKNPQRIPLALEAIVAPISVDLIIDKATIKRNNLLAFFPSHFAEGKLLENLHNLQAKGKQKKRAAGVGAKQAH